MLGRAMYALKNHMVYRRWRVLQHGRAVVYYSQVRCGSTFAAWKAYSLLKRQHSMKISIAVSRAASRRQKGCLEALILHAHDRQQLRQSFHSVLVQIRLKLVKAKLLCILKCWRELAALYTKLQSLSMAMSAASCLNLRWIITQTCAIKHLAFGGLSLMFDNAAKFQVASWRSLGDEGESDFSASTSTGTHNFIETCTLAMGEEFESKKSCQRAPGCSGLAINTCCIVMLAAEHSKMMFQH